MAKRMSAPVFIRREFLRNPELSWEELQDKMAAKGMTVSHLLIMATRSIYIETLKELIRGNWFTPKERKEMRKLIQRYRHAQKKRRKQRRRS